MVNNEGHLLATNQLVADMLGLRCRDLQAKKLIDFVTESPHELKEYLKACSTSRAMVIGTLTLRQRNGEKLICRSQGAVIQPWSPESPALILLRLENKVMANSNFILLNKKIDELRHEIQHRQQVEFALAKANEELEHRVEERTNALQETLKELQLTQTQLIQAEKMSSLGQVVAGIAHEINNPVSFILGNLYHTQQYTSNLLKLVEVYQKYLPNPPLEVEKTIETIDLNFLIQDLNKIFHSMKVGAERIKKIVNSLRNFSRLDEANIKKVDIHEGIDSTLMLLSHRLQIRHQSLTIQLIKNYDVQLPKITCCPDQLNQVFMNIITNAIDALEDLEDMVQEAPTITIQTKLIDINWIEITIADNGVGISEKNQSKLFDPFFTTKPVGKGTGLGLSISYQIIVKKHNGKLNCYSTPGEGAKFAIQLPISL
ncbi:ATP-binding protein [Anabaena sp. UHCC 0399]|uniref:ATP-binding protein n=1 Tax=Anabaena sp. UHCC 0399 TaxID=3110238 RepID=UPI002B1F1756|nr:ATP-binding protein [Anabaena sp. UHCC 0399]MEA5565036.1 ATP-binding protein [Anabaena sp. UHCC 0399]